MKRQEYSTKEALERVKLMINYDSRKTLTENKESILLEDHSSTIGLTSAGIGVACTTLGVIAGVFTFGVGSVAGVGCLAAAAGIQYLYQRMTQSSDPRDRFQHAVEAGQKLVSDYKAEKTSSFDEKVAAKTMYNAMYETWFGTGIGTNEVAINTVMDDVVSLVDLYYMDKYFRTSLSPGERLSDALESELETIEWAPILDKLEVMEKALRDLEKAAKKEKDKTEKEEEKTGKSDARKEKYGCLSDIGKLFNSNAVTIPSEDDGGYCMAFYNAGTQTFDSGRLLCYNNSKVKTGSGYWSCSGGKFSVRKYVVDSIEIKKGNLLSELKVGGVDLNKSFNNERTSNSGNGRVSPGKSKWKNCTDSYMKLCKEDDINGVLHKVQSCLGVKSDGLFGNRTETALFNKTGKKTFTTNDVNTICGLQQKQDDEYTIDRGNDAVDNTQGI